MKSMETAKKPITLGSSLLVPSVQELAKQPLVQVPPRYVRSNQDHAPTLCDISTISTIPVIDLQCLLSSEAIGDSELEKLHSACKEWGFFQLVNHGVSPSLVEKAKSEIQNFFRLPMEEKKKYWQEEGQLEGFGQACVVSKEQKLDWAGLFFMFTLPLYERKPHLFPMLPLPLRETLESYSSELKILTMTLLKMIAKALQIGTKEMTELFEDGLQSMRMNYYPPCPQPELVMGLAPHSDATGLTILLQLNEMEGLQIRKDGRWVPVKPLPNAFIVNIGDILGIATNGIYRSVEHRATVNSTKERLSIATFHNPSLEYEIGPLPSLITSDRPAMFRSVQSEEYTKKLLTRALDGKSVLDSMRIEAGCGDGKRT